VDLCDVRMIEGSERVSFALESGQPLRVTGEKRWQDFQRDVTPQPGVARAVHFAQAAGTDGSDDLVRTESRARAEKHRR
jgi:hypothetical protein